MRIRQATPEQRAEVRSAVALLPAHLTDGLTFEFVDFPTIRRDGRALLAYFLSPGTWAIAKNADKIEFIHGVWANGRFAGELARREGILHEIGHCLASRIRAGRIAEAGSATLAYATAEMQRACPERSRERENGEEAIAQGFAEHVLHGRRFGPHSDRLFEVLLSPDRQLACMVQAG